MGLNPVKASEHIVDKYIRYLSTIFDIKDNHYKKQFTKELQNSDQFAAGPYLDVTTSFEKGDTLKQLISEDKISKYIGKLNMQQERPLYKHQEIAISKAIAGRNIVVSTGTGSGKTESFLIPIFNHLCRQLENGELNEGVRALIIYPMNALANDQMERLRELLQEIPEITYGSYTGQTKSKYEDALVEFKSLNNGEMPPKNELISREQMKNKPPHILITNYAMLEYLMIRPEDSIFFSDSYAKLWKFIVLDEAHVYNGSTGIEVSMLLRRLKAKLNNDKIQYILTSATLGSEEEDREVADFASNLCNTHFNQDDIIRAYKTTIDSTIADLKLGPEFYHEITRMMNDHNNEDEILRYLKKSFPIKKAQPLTNQLYDLIIRDRDFWRIKELVENPQTIKKISDAIGWSIGDLTSFVTVASACEKNGDRVFDARYHMFIRATESIFITLGPSNKLFLMRKDVHYERNGEEYKVFEIATCTFCHHIYLVGKVENNYLEQSSRMANSLENSIFLLGDEISDTDEDHSLENENIQAEEYEICSRCGYLRRKGSKNSCEHDDRYYTKVYKVKIKNDINRLTKCLSCENTNNSGVLRMFFTGQEAVTSVLGTAIFEELPSYIIIQKEIEEEDDSGFEIATSPSLREEKIKEAKQFIAFSDSRQAAAFYATYLDQTYRNILYKRLVVETLKDDIYGKRSKGINQFVDDLTYQFEKFGVASQNYDMTYKEAWKAVLQELVNNNGNTSLYSMGLLGLSIKDGLTNSKYKLSDGEVNKICSIFVLGMMRDAALLYSANLTRADKDYFTHNGIECSYTMSDSDAKKYRRSFIPTKAHLTNKRLEYLSRVLVKKGVHIDKTEATKFLENIWKHIFIGMNIVQSVNGSYKIDTSKIMISKNNQWYICPKCKKITMHNVENVCPTYKCDGELGPIDTNKVFENNHYYQLFQGMDIRELRVVEHTAQLNKETAYDYQKKFQRKEIDILSCSTTFEMGVDVGSLETVFMRNMPPSPANYAQRAGRAGRSRESAAYALTFCNKSNHDFTFFKTPKKMIKGKIVPPKFNINNDKIAIRHVYASALSFFWRKYPQYFSKVSDLLEDIDGTNGFVDFCNFLKENPKSLKEYLVNFLPQPLVDRLRIGTYDWVGNLIREDEVNPGVLAKAIAEYNYEVNILQDSVEDAFRAGKRVDHLRERIKVYRNEDVLSFLSRKNVLPKYGFPVDTVEMSIMDYSNKGKLGLQLQRDLSMAISEYAPGSQIVANGNLITSRYIRKIPNMSWKMFDYIICDHCRTLNIEPHTIEEEDNKIESCRQCGNSFESTRSKVFLIPEFGFQANGDKIEKPGLIKPERTYRSEIAYVGYKSNIDMRRIDIRGAEIELGMSLGDEMAVLNESNFYVCQSCGYTDLDESCYVRSKKLKHKNAAGYQCRNNMLRRFSLGYRFETDVLLLRFLNPDLADWEVAISVLHGLLRGISSYLNIEQSDISGCLQFFYNDFTDRGNFSLVLYDKTPGGAGHVRRLNDPHTLEGVIGETLKLMENCSCGGEQMDSSCYSCLRSYYNQNHHDILKRKHVINFIKDIYCVEAMSF